MIIIKKIFKYLFVILLLITIFTKFNITNVKAETEITTFEEYEEQVKKLDVVMLFVVPIVIIGIGSIYYITKNRKKVRELRLKK